jgi:outer membrane protein W
MLQKDDDETYSDNYKMNPGFHVGATMDFSLSDLLSIETGLLLTTKGVKIEEEEMGFKISGKGNLYYLDIPITVKLGYDLGGAKIYGAIGPYVGMGLSGKTEATFSYQGSEETESEDVSWGSGDTDDLKRLDVGLTFGGGVEISAIQIGVSYDLGMSNISAYTDYGTSSKNRVLKFSIGYRFGM